MKLVTAASVKATISLATLLIVAASMPEHARAASATVVKEWKLSDAGAASISPDGNSVARVENGQLFINNSTTGNDTLILSSAEGMNIGSQVSYSPDGSRLVFGAGNRVAPYTGRVYSVQTDGSNLVRLAPSDPNQATACKYNPDAGLDPPTYAALERKGQLADAPECSVTLQGSADSIYSPDGTKIMVQVVTNTGARDRSGLLNSQNDTWYVGLVSPSGAKQEPENVSITRGAFWSSDGKAIYYSKKTGDCNPDCKLMAYKLDLSSGQSASTGHRFRGFKVPGTDVLFLRNDNVMSVVPLQAGVTVDSALVQAIESVPFQDSEGRGLTEIQAANGAKRLLLLYGGQLGGETSLNSNGDKSFGSPAYGNLTEHYQLVSYGAK